MNVFCKEYKIRQYSESSLIISWSNKKFDPDFVYHQQAFITFLKKKDSHITYLIPSFNALLINYEGQTNINSKKVQMHSHIKDFSKSKIQFPEVETHQIPVCYEDFGLDLKVISEKTGLGISDIIQMHSERTYTLFFIGFLPGFLYLGQLDESLHFPRKETPRPEVEQGSIGIAEHQTGIYPNASPGGWQIIGRTPINIFDVNNNPPSSYKPGDKIKFKPIGRTEFDKLINNPTIAVE